MPVKSILALVSGDSASESVVETAFVVASRFNAHVAGLHVRGNPVDNLPFLFEGYSEERIREEMAVVRIREEDAERHAQQCFEDIREQRGVPYRDAAPSKEGSTASWQVLSGREREVMGEHGRVHDLTVIGPSTAASRDPTEL